MGNVARENTLNPEIIREVRGYQRKLEEKLSRYAFRDADAVRYCPEDSMRDDPRPAFFHDTDRIVHSLAYTRYIDKTQVFYLIRNDHITHRVLHVQLVSKIARTIGRFLGLNEDLIEAISLGHDVGHSPFGHKGEKLLSEFGRKNGAGIFEHNVQSFRLFHQLARNGKGCNLTIQVLDGIICHNGEMLQKEYRCNSSKTGDGLLSEYERSLVTPGVSSAMIPMTLEGCVMRISDVIAYIGRDIEDAITIGLIDREDLPGECVEILGNDNGVIVNNLLVDLVNNSFGKDCLCFSHDVFSALDVLKEWNFKNIYVNPRITTQDRKIDNMFNVVLETCVDDLRKGTDYSRIRSRFLVTVTDDYLQTNSPERMALDYVSGMTDKYMTSVFDDIVVPHMISLI